MIAWVEDVQQFPSPIGEVVSYIISAVRGAEKSIYGLPSPIGEVVSYIIYVRDRKTGLEYSGFPSPIGEVVSYMLSGQISGIKINTPFPSPVGEVVSYIERRGKTLR